MVIASIAFLMIVRVMLDGVKEVVMSKKLKTKSRKKACTVKCCNFSLRKVALSVAETMWAIGVSAIAAIGISAFTHRVERSYSAQLLPFLA